MAKTALDPDQLAGNFAEIRPPFTPDEARAQASRCLFCFDAPCTRACPTHIDVPRFIRQILHSNPAGAAETIIDSNVLGGSCARVCPTEVLCEGACVDRTLQGEAVPIGGLQRFAVDWADENGLSFFEPGTDTGCRVAVVGSGPAGLSCAFELRRRGHEVTIFEASDLAGGLNAIGIAAYKITTDYALSEVERVTAVGAEIRFGTPVDGAGLAKLLAPISHRVSSRDRRGTVPSEVFDPRGAERVLAVRRAPRGEKTPLGAMNRRSQQEAGEICGLEDYDAVFLGIGLGATASLGILGEDANGVWEALDFIFQTHRKPFADCEVGRRVVVIGGGNTAIDAATAAVRLGAERVTIAYRRTRADMPAYEHEYELARGDGVVFEWLTAPLECVETDGSLTGLRMQRLEMQGHGREAQLAPIPDSEFILECDMVVKALGQQPLVDFMGAIDGLEVDRGRLVVDPDSGVTSVPGLFAGGDCISKGAEVVNAVEEGKIAARGISDFIDGRGEG